MFPVTASLKPPSKAGIQRGSQPIFPSLAEV
jgi:hypothetical protein